MNPTKQTYSCLLRRAFTLIELMVVIGIIVIIIAVSLPAIKALTKGNDTAQATSMLSSLIANARSIAISQGRSAALILYEENAGVAAQTTAVFAVEDRNPPAGSLATDLYLIPLTNIVPQKLPTSSKIAGLSEAAAMGSLSVNATPSPRIVLFDNLGQMSLRGPDVNGIGGVRLSASSTETTTDAILQKWRNPDFGGSGPWTATPGFVVYSAEEYKSKPTSMSDNTWLLQHAKVLVINAYTGTVIQ